ncbi:MAG TPA: plastocyanin/azurin family copper-binding protein [Acidimicrobiales bacterium]|nr:plastocyanin/azurin family copper-binding protein [Acidimicrobiales bacterium]
MTRRLDGYRSSAAGVLLYLVVIAAVSPFLLPAPPARAAFREVGIVDDEFEPPEIIVQRGDTVVWIHRGARPHGVRATDGSFESSPGCSFQNGGACMRNGSRYSRTFDQAGTFSYYCPVHGSANGVGMAGQVTVASGDGGGTTTTTVPPPPPTTTTRPSGSTTMRPSTTRPAPTQPPGSPTTTTAGSSTPPPSQGTETTDLSVPVGDQGTTTSLVAGVPINGDTDGDDGGSNLLIGLAAAVILAAAVSATAWYYRPGVRPPGGPPPPVGPA